MSNITVTDTTYNITVSETSSSVEVTAGDAITVLVNTFEISTGVINSGSGAEVAKPLAGDTLVFRTLVNTDGDIAITQNTDDISLDLSDNIEIATLQTSSTITASGNITAPNLAFNGTISGPNWENAAAITGDNNITITTGATNYLHANTGNVYVGSLTQAAHITGSSIGSIGNPLSIVGNFTGDVVGQVSDISNHTTTDLTEGVNLYYTQGRFDTAFAAKSTTDLTEGLNLYYTDGRFDARLATKTTTDLTEGLNLYYTQARFDSAFSNKTTTDLTEGTNLYWTQGRFDSAFSLKYTDDLTEGNTNLYYTDARVDTYLQSGGVSSINFGNNTSLTWNDDDGTLEFPVNNEVTLQIGQENLIHVKNLSGATLTNGTVVAVTGASGSKLTVDLADYTDEGLSSATIAVMTQDLNNNGVGYATTTGLVRGLNTSSFTEGDTLWLDGNGTFVSTKPLTPKHLVQVGWVVRSHATEGSIFVYVKNGWELEELHDVLITSAADGDLVRWNNTGSYWENQSLETALSTIGGDVLPSTTLTYDLGSSSLKWQEAHINTVYADTVYMNTLDNNGNPYIEVKASLLPDLNQIHSLGSSQKSFSSVYIGPGSLYVDGQKVLGSDETGDIDLTTDAGQNLNISSGADIQFLTQANATGTQAFTVNLTDINLGPSGGGATVNVNGLLEAPDLHIGDLEIEPGLINYNQTGQNLEIKTNGTGYIHANTADFYIGAGVPGVDQFVKIDETSISKIGGGTLTITGDLTGDVTGTVSDISNHTTSNLTEGSNLYFTDARAISAVEGEATLDLTGQVTMSQDLDVSGLIKVNDGFTLSTFNPYAAFGGTSMPTTIMGVGQQSGWTGVTVRSRGEHNWGLSGFGIPPEAPRALNAMMAGRLNGSSDDYLNSGDLFAQIMMNPYSGYRTGTEWLTPAASIEAHATENHSSGGMGTKLRIGTTENGDFAGATDSQHIKDYIEIQGTTLTTSGTLKIADDLIVTGSISNDSGDIVINDKVEINGSNAKETIIGDDTIAGVFDIHGIKVKADDTAWGSILIQEYVGGANKPFASGFANPSFGTEIIGGTPSSPTNVDTGKRLFLLQALAANQTNGTLPTTSNFRIKAETTEAQTLTNRGTKVSIETIANGAAGTQESLVIQGNEVTINSTGNGVLKTGGDLLLGSRLDTNNYNIINSGGDVTIDDNLKVNSTLTVDGTANFNGNVNLGNANTDSIQATGYLKANNGFGLTVLNTATANYLSGVLGIISTGDVAYISDGDSGNPCIGVYNGSSWKRIALGSDISSS